MKTKAKGCCMAVAVWFDVRVPTDHTEQGLLDARTRAAETAALVVRRALRRLATRGKRELHAIVDNRRPERYVRVRTGGD